MWAGFFKLLGLSATIATASFAAGSLPIALSLSQRRLKYVSALGIGVLVGSSLVVIIPEGIDALYSSSEEHQNKHHGSHAHSWAGPALLSGFLLMYLIDRFPRKDNGTPINGTITSGTSMSLPTTLSSHISLTELSHNSSNNVDDNDTHKDIHRDQDYDDNLTLPNSHLLPSHTSQHDHPDNDKPPATTVGLVIHSAADGIALGASSSLSSSSLSLVVFVAIMVHKAPAAFGLTSVLLRQGLTKRNVRAHLVVFSLAAPVGALTVWLLINLLGRHWLGGEQGTKFATGLVLLFSGGTFLYVAMNTIQESELLHPSEAPIGIEHEPRPVLSAHSKPTVAEASTTILGMLIPLLTQLGHAH